MDFGLKGRRALLLASSQGLGYGVARGLAAEGADVILTGRDADKLTKAAGAISSLGKGQAHWLRADLGHDGDVAAMLKQVEDKWGGVDVLVNNTGGPPSMPLADADPAVWPKYFETMLMPVFLATSALLPGMRARGFGRVITLASSGVIEPIAGLGLSNALRSTLVGWSKTLAGEVAKDGVTVNMVAPGRIHTQRVDEIGALAAKRANKTVAEIAKESHERIPAGRYGSVEEFANVAVFLASGAASYVTGALLRVDGGMTRSV